MRSRNIIILLLQIRAMRASKGKIGRFKVYLSKTNKSVNGECIMPKKKT